MLILSTGDGGLLSLGICPYFLAWSKWLEHFRSSGENAYGMIVSKHRVSETDLFERPIFFHVIEKNKKRKSEISAIKLYSLP